MSSTMDYVRSVDPAAARISDELRSTEVFSVLTAGEALEVAQVCERRLLAPEDLLFQEGEDALYLYIVLRGELRILVSSPDGSETIDVGRARPGALVGEMAVLEAVPRSASAQASEATEVLQMPARAFAELVASGHAAAFAILRTLQHTLSARLRDLNLRIDAVFQEAEPEALADAEPSPTLWHLLDPSKT